MNLQFIFDVDGYFKLSILHSSTINYYTSANMCTYLSNSPGKACLLIYLLTICSYVLKQIHQGLIFNFLLTPVNKLLIPHNN